MTLTSMKLLEYADRELVGIVSDLADDEGWALTADIAERLALDHDRPTQCVGARLAWLKRYKVVEGHERGSRWRVTAHGEMFLNGRLSAATKRALADLDPGEFLSITRALTGQWQGSGEPTQHMVRREWKRGLGQR